MPRTMFKMIAKAPKSKPKLLVRGFGASFMLTITVFALMLMFLPSTSRGSVDFIIILLVEIKKTDQKGYINDIHRECPFLCGEIKRHSVDTHARPCALVFITIKAYKMAVYSRVAPVIIGCVQRVTA